MLNKLGYRIETYGGSGVRDLRKIMLFEILELDNTEIFDFVYNNYTRNFDVKHLTNELRTIPNKLKHIVNVINGYTNSKTYESGVTLYTDQDIENMVDDIIKFLSYVYKKDLKYGLWLCDKMEDCIYMYSKNDDDNVFIYQAGDVTISDLGRDGKLYAYENEPQLAYTNVVCA